MIPRKELLKKLATVDGALAPLTSLIPLNAHFWFTGRRLMAFNGRMAIMVPCTTDFKGGVPRKLATLLKTTAAEEIEMTGTADTLTVKAGKSKWKMPLLPPDFTFKMPSSITMSFGKPLLVDAGRFVQSMEAVLKSCGKMTHTIDMLGVTLVQSDDGWIDLFSTDAETMSAATIRYDGGLCTKKFKRLIIPTDWCREFIKLAAGLPELYLDITDEYALFDIPGGASLYTAVIEPEKKPLPFREMLDTVYTLSAENGRVKIPEDILPVLERATIMTTRAKEAPSVMFEIDGADLTVAVQSENGELREMLHIGPGHRKISVPVNVARVLDGAKHFDKMTITDEAVIMTRDKCVYMVSPVSGV